MTFNQFDGGRLFNFIPNGVTLDLKGSIINNNQSNKVYFNINKAINLISSTHDGYIDLNTTAGSLMGDNPGNRFIVSHGGSWSNITGIKFHNTQLWIANTTHVVVDNISVVVEDQRIGSGVGVTAIRENATWVTVKNSYFRTKNNGGSSSLVIAWADYCTFDNNTVVGEGTVGNLIYLTTFVNGITVSKGVQLNVHNNITNNKIYGPQMASPICIALQMQAYYTLLANNTCYYSGPGLNSGTYATVINNIAASTITIGVNSTGYNNHAGTTLTVGAGAEAFNNTASTLTVNGANAYAHNNNVSRTITVSGAEAKLFNNNLNGTIKFTGANLKINNNNISGTITISGATGVFVNNTINGTTTLSGNGVIINNTLIDGTLTISGNNAKIINNTIKADVLINSNNIFVANCNISSSIIFSESASGNSLFNNFINTTEIYAIDVSQSENNNITKNTIYAPLFKGDDAIKTGKTVNNINNNYPVGVDLKFTIEDITPFKTNTTVNITFNKTATGNIRVIVNGETYFITNIKNGEASLVLYKKDFNEGEYNIIVMYDGDSQFDQSQKSSTFNVSYYETALDITVDESVKAGDDLKINFTLSCVDNSSVIISPEIELQIVIDGVKHNIDFESDKAYYTMKNVDAGTHTIIASYLGENGYKSSDDFKTFTISKITPIVNIAVDDLKLGEDANVTVTIINATGKVNIIINGAENIVDLEEGVAITSIKNVVAGNYIIVANYEGDAKNNPAFNSTSKELKVMSTKFSEVKIDGDLNINAILLDGDDKPVANAIINYTLGDVANTTVSDNNGSFTIKGLPNSKLTIRFEGNDILLATSDVIVLDDVAHSKVATNIDANSLNCYAVDYSAGERGVMFNAVLKDVDGKAIADANVKISFNNNIYDVVTNSDGVASIQVNAISSSNYACSIYYLGGVNNEPSFKTVNIAVNKKSVKIIAKATKFKVKTKVKKYTISLNTILGSSADGRIHFGAGKVVTLKIKGKTYSAKTNAAGKATFKIKLNKKGKFSSKIKFAGDDTYNAASKSVKITIK